MKANVLSSDHANGILKSLHTYPKLCQVKESQIERTGFRHTNHDPEILWLRWLHSASLKRQGLYKSSKASVILVDLDRSSAPQHIWFPLLHLLHKLHCVKSLPSQISNPPPPTPEEHLKRDKSKPARKRTRPSNIPVIQAMFSLPQQIYTVVSDGSGFLLKHNSPIINSGQLTPSDTCASLPDSAGLFPGWGLVCGGGLAGLKVLVKEGPATVPPCRLPQIKTPLWKMLPKWNALLSVQSSDKNCSVIFLYIFPFSALPTINGVRFV